MHLAVLPAWLGGYPPNKTFSGQHLLEFERCDDDNARACLAGGCLDSLLDVIVLMYWVQRLCVRALLALLSYQCDKI